MDPSKPLPPIPNKRYFTIGETSVLCGVKAYVLRYWEQEFTQLKPMKRRGNRRYYQHGEVLLIRRIRALLYDEGFTISGARNRLAEEVAAARRAAGPSAGDGDRRHGPGGGLDGHGPGGDDAFDDDDADTAAGDAAQVEAAADADAADEGEREHALRRRHGDRGAPVGDGGRDGATGTGPGLPTSSPPPSRPTAQPPATESGGAAATAADAFARLLPGAVDTGSPWRDPLLVRAVAWAAHAPSYAPPPAPSQAPTPRAGAVPLDAPALLAELLSIRAILSP